MKVLIRFITTNAAGGEEQNDRTVDAPVITIGRATDQILHIRDRRARLQHAQITQEQGEICISTNALAGVTVNGRSQRSARLVSGDVVEVGANTLTMIDAPAGYDCALTFELSESARSEGLATDWRMPQTGLRVWSKRRLSWALAATVLVIALLIPGLSLLPPVADVMRASRLLPDDSLWLAGPVHSAHAATSTECQNCHVALFERVPDAACMACHEAERHSDDPQFAVLGQMRCAACHLEHNEPPQLVKRHQGLCADCHGDLPGGSLENASDFLDSHPPFKVSLLLPEIAANGETAWNLQHVELGAFDEGERSNLKFDHQVHLDPDGIVTPDGRRVIECGECHQPEPGGARMLPISMDEHCSGCHALTFDADDPTRQVPHGDPEGVMQVLIEYYSARLLGADPDQGEQRLRRPGQNLSRADRDRAAAEARVQALAIAEDLFERRACVNCHVVTRNEDNSELPWHVAPVRLTTSFFPHARFSHAAHDTEVTSCDGCHGASASSASHDLLIPGIENCRECHGSGEARRNDAAQTPSACVMCHNFHFAAKGPYP